LMVSSNSTWVDKMVLIIAFISLCLILMSWPVLSWPLPRPGWS
jgi:hypothetical protein